MADTLFFFIDDKEYEAKSGQTILAAAVENDVYIPTLCAYHGLHPAGTCRICTVRVNGRTMAACTTPVTDNMVVENDVPDIQDMRKSIVEMLFVEGNHMCPTCEKSGNCELQALAYRFGILAPRFPYLNPDRSVSTYTQFIMDHNRCVQCRRCVRAIRDEEGRHVFSVADRGDRTHIIADMGLADSLDEATAQKAMDICPVGAILQKERGFQVPIGSRQYDAEPIGSGAVKGGVE